MRLFKIKNLKFWSREALPLPQWDRRGSLPDATYSARASIQPLMRCSTPSPLAVFGQFKHCTHEHININININDEY